MPPFTPLRDRDAWSTIRGYVYQVDLTIQRWLDLAPHQILELERGEDIDIVSRALTADSEERDRLLEQVKHRDSSITLRTPEAVAAIACFIEHCQSNPTADLIFQFTTNTKIVKERQCSLPERMPAIEAWERLRQGTLQEGIRDAVLAGIRQILRNAKKPDDLQKDTWQRFCNFIQTATDEKLLNLIHKFQWRTKAPDARSLSSTLQRELLDRRHATTSLQAQEQYQRLFWYVFNRLCERGRKQLTLEELHDQLTLPTLSSSDRETLEILRNWLQEIDVRVTNLEQGQQRTNQVVADLRAEVQQLARSQGIDGAVSYVVSTLILDVPPLVERSSLRVETIESLAQVLTNHTWIAIYGSLGSGKTQLAVLLVEYLISQGLCTYCPWLRLRDLTIEQACLRLDQAVETLVGNPCQGNLNEWYSQLCDDLDSTAILVLDDLPRLERADELEERLIQLARVCRNKGVRLLSTSPHQLPQNLRAVLGSQILHSIQTPLFTKSRSIRSLPSLSCP
jgi:DNA replication protein DnaC